MGFRFRVGKVWRIDDQIVLIGILESGKIAPPVTAHVAGRPDEAIPIEGIAMGCGKPLTGKPNEFTLRVSSATCLPQDIEGRLLVGSSDIAEPKRHSFAIQEGSK